MKTIFVAFIFLFILFGNLKSQDFVKDSNDTIKKNENISTSFSLGLGIGLDYGGIGCRISSISNKYLLLFFGFGYNLNSVGVNLGGVVKLFPDKIISPFIGGMYGYNATIVITGTSGYNKSYYGPSVTIGTQIRPSIKSNNYFSLGLIIPFWPENFKKDLSSLKRNPSVKIESEPSDVLFSVGYHINI